MQRPGSTARTHYPSVCVFIERWAKGPRRRRSPANEPNSCDAASTAGSIQLGWASSSSPDVVVVSILTCTFLLRYFSSSTNHAGWNPYDRLWLSRLSLISSSPDLPNKLRSKFDAIANDLNLLAVDKWSDRQINLMMQTWLVCYLLRVLCIHINVNEETTVITSAMDLIPIHRTKLEDDAAIRARWECRFFFFCIFGSLLTWRYNNPTISICKQINWSHLFWIKRFSVRITILNWWISKEIVVTVYIFLCGSNILEPPCPFTENNGALFGYAWTTRWTEWGRRRWADSI